MKDKNIDIDYSFHIPYSKKCKRAILKKIALHYGVAKREEIWKRVQHQYSSYLSGLNTNYGGKKNFHNKAGGNYDCIALTSYYVVCKDVTSIEEIEEMEKSLFLPSFSFLSKLVDCNKPFFKRLLYKSFLRAKKGCDRWKDYKMNVSPYTDDKPISYEFTFCPVAEFTKAHEVEEIMPAFCNPDYDAMEKINARLIRKTTCANGEKCDYIICGNKDSFITEHPEYVESVGFRRNR